MSKPTHTEPIMLQWHTAACCGRPSCEPTDQRCGAVCVSIRDKVYAGWNKYDATRAHLAEGYALPPNPEPKPQPRYCCAECKGTDIQCAVWVNPNTREAFDDFGSWNNIDTQWCNYCGEHTTFETLPTFTVANHGGAK